MNYLHARYVYGFKQQFSAYFMVSEKQTLNFYLDCCC